ncbi:hypothetical protein BH24ACT5_BH24ACT5_32250 [soil metagenome]
MNAFTPAGLAAYVEHGFGPVDTSDPDGPVQLRCDPDLEADTFLAAPTMRTFDLLAEVRVPVTVVGGRNDHPGPADLAEPVATELPAGQFAPRPDLDHFGPFVEPATVAELILGALS